MQNLAVEGVVYDEVLQISGARHEMVQKVKRLKQQMLALSRAELLTQQK